ncbi:hypothetical protein JOQ06_006937 [Pogonophryne albipinna]|uniref:Uncharacterized protein n=1 Tax=Pogonophryne albipinna TaxID=1090488 RepID=A0AAD6FGP3_9TELE|nr:hypothetical protein JOQ06_006937 [Pogonophryne albipinna]
MFRETWRLAQYHTMRSMDQGQVIPAVSLSRVRHPGAAQPVKPHRDNFERCWQFISTKLCVSLPRRIKAEA